MVSIENLVHNDCFDYFSCIYFLSTPYLRISYLSFLRFLSHRLFPSDPIFYSQTLLFGNSYFWVFLFSSGSFPFIFSSFTLNLLSILPSSKLLAIFILLSIFLLFKLCVYYVDFRNFCTFEYVLQDEVQNLG